MTIEEFRVEAAAKALSERRLKVADHNWKEDARVAVEAAYAAKPPEEIVVTMDMIGEGLIAAHPARTPRSDELASIYRAMRKAAPKESNGEAACADRPLTYQRVREAVDKFLDGLADQGSEAACAAEVTNHVHSWVRASLSGSISKPTAENFICGACGCEARMTIYHDLTRHKAGTTREALRANGEVLRHLVGGPAPTIPIKYQRKEVKDRHVYHYLSENERSGKERRVRMAIACEIGGVRHWLDPSDSRWTIDARKSQRRKVSP